MSRGSVGTGIRSHDAGPRLGAGVSHAIGTGGRDLHAAVGGITTHQALERLGADAETHVIVIVSKPSSREVADGVLAAAARLGKPVIACLLGYGGATLDGVRAVATLEEAAVNACGRHRPGRGTSGRPRDARTVGGAFAVSFRGKLFDERRARRGTRTPRG